MPSAQSRYECRRERRWPCFKRMGKKGLRLRRGRQRLLHLDIVGARQAGRDVRSHMRERWRKRGGGSVGGIQLRRRYEIARTASLFSRDQPCRLKVTGYVLYSFASLRGYGVGAKRVGSRHDRSNRDVSFSAINSSWTRSRLVLPCPVMC